MKNTGFKRIVSLLLVLLMVVPSMLWAIPASAAEAQDSAGLSDSASNIALGDNLDAENYTSYILPFANIVAAV